MKDTIIGTTVGIAFAIAVGYVMYVEKPAKIETQYILVSSTKVETQYWGEVINVVKYKTKNVQTTVTKPDGTKIETKVVETESNVTKSETQKVTSSAEATVSESIVSLKSVKSNYSLGIGYRVDKGVLSFGLSEMVISGKIRLAEAPILLTVSVGNMFKEYTLGLELEI